MKVPGPNHPITVTAADQRWRARFNGHVIADSAGALILKEADHAPVVYFPREAVSMEYLTRTSHASHCPYKGDAAYYTLVMDGHFLDNVVWTYEQPYPAMSAIEGYLAFYRGRGVDIYAVDDAVVNPRHIEEHVDEVVRHTDAGGGQSQADRWPPNVGTPGVEGGVR